MGTEPKRLIKALQSNPDSLAWSIPREVHIIRGPTGKLGLRFQTVQCNSQKLSNTLVIVVRDTCVIQSGELRKLDRIHKINGISLSDKTEDEVDAIFKDQNQLAYNLEVQSEVSLTRKDICATENQSQTRSFDCACSDSMEGTGSNTVSSGVKPKRMLSYTSSTSKNSAYGDRPSGTAPNKRFQKSNSTEQDEAGQQTEMTSAAMVPHPLAPSADGYVPDLEAGSQHRMNSLPDRVSFTQIGIEIEEEERVQSLPTMNGTGRPVGTFHGCDNGVGTVTQDRKQILMSVRPCRDQNCHKDRDSCLWHSLIFRFPQFVVWDPMSKTVTLTKGSNSFYGIKKKLKIHEATGEMYTLVDSVASKSLAEKHGLHVGDWIQSINSKALQSREEAYRTNFDQYSEIRLVIQRPKGILQKAEAQAFDIKQRVAMRPLKMPDKRHLTAVNSPPSPTLHHSPSPRNMTLSPNIPPSQPYLSSPHAVRQVSPMSESKPMSRHPGYNIDPCTMSPGVTQTKNVIYEREYMGSRTPEVRCVTCGNGQPHQMPLPSSPQSPDSNCTSPYGSGGASPRSPRDGLIPCGRVFICGNSAPDLANMILSRSRVHQNVSQDSHVQVVKFSLKQYENSNVFVDVWQKWKNGSRDQFRGMNGTGYFNPSTSGTCNQCGNDGTSVNVELFVIQDENFFHHCSQYLFTNECIFLIAFNAQRILTNMSSDITRLEQLIHTIHSHVGTSARIDVFGMLPLETEEDKDDEVRTMFYANDKKHGKYSVSIPHITFITRLNMLDTVFSLCTDMFGWTLSHHQKKPSAVEVLAEVLSGLEHESRSVWSTDEIRQRIAMMAPQCKDLFWQGNISLLEQMGCIKCTTEKCTCIQELTSRQDYFVNPVSAQKRLVRLCIDSKEKIDGDLMFILSATGVMLRSELSALLQDIVPDVDPFLRCLQTLGVVYDIGPGYNRHDRAMFLPYFLEDIVCDQNHVALDDLCLLAVFSEAVPWTVFYSLVSALGQRPECKKIEFSRKRSCVINLKDVTLSLCFDKMNDRIVILVEKTANSVKENIVLQMFQRLLADIVPTDRPYILGPPCPLTEPHSHTPGHVINLMSASVTCSEICLKSHSKVKRWLTIDQQQSGDDYLARNILKLPPGVFQSVTDKLLVPSRNDWTDLAGRLNKTSEDVEIYIAQGRSIGTVPSKLLLVDWDRMGEGTIGQLIEHLTAMERPDVRDIITDYLRIKLDD